MSEADDRSLLTYAAVATDYVTRWGKDVEQEERWFGSNCKSLAMAIERASMSRIPSGNSGKQIRHPYQQRIPSDILKAVATELSSNEAVIWKANSFHNLHEIICDAVLAMPGVGALLVYDIAHRIGCNMQLFPKAVYLHRGTKSGAKALGLATNRTCIPLNELPPALRKLSGAQLEDVFCLYRGTLARLHQLGEEGPAGTEKVDTNSFRNAHRQRRFC